MPGGARELAAPGGAGVARPGVSRRQRLRRRRPDVLRLDPVPGDRRDQPAADRMGQPPDVPAGRRDPWAIAHEGESMGQPMWRAMTHWKNCPGGNSSGGGATLLGFLESSPGELPRAILLSPIALRAIRLITGQARSPPGRSRPIFVRPVTPAAVFLSHPLSRRVFSVQDRRPHRRFTPNNRSSTCPRTSSSHLRGSPTSRPSSIN